MGRRGQKEYKELDLQVTSAVSFHRTRSASFTMHAIIVLEQEQSVNSPRLSYFSSQEG